MAGTDLRRSSRLRLAIAFGTLLACLSVSTVLAGDGNNGTVKIHDASVAADPITKNEPHVCTFDIQFLFADAGQVGGWWIDQQPPTGRDASGVSGSYTADANGAFQTGAYGLPAGHYQLSWQGRNDQNVKHKTFWVTCDNPPGPIGGVG
jgi:hypothetical protein